MRILIAYASKTGSAKKLADHVALGCKAAGFQPELRDLGDSYALFDYLGFLRQFRGQGKPSSITHDTSPFDLIFLGFEIHNLSQSNRLLDFIAGNDFAGKKIALFCSYYINRKYLQRIEGELRKKDADVSNTLSLKRKGLEAFFGKGGLDENDLVRAEAFAERTINNILGRKIQKESEKGQIRNYRK